jgi:TolB-like protein
MRTVARLAVVVICGISWFPAVAGGYPGLTHLVDSIAAGIPAAEKTARIAIFPFVNSSRFTDKTLGARIAGFVIAGLDERSSLALPSAEEFQRAIDKSGVPQPEMIGLRSAAQVGKLLGASFVVMGDFSDKGGYCTVTATLFRTETNEIVARKEVVLTPGTLARLSEESFDGANAIRGSVLRSLALPGWGQMHTSHYVRGGIAMGLGLGTVGFFALSVAQAGKANTALEAHKEIEADFLGLDHEKWKADYDVLDDDKVSPHRQATIAGIVLASVWSINLVDALVAGNQEQRRFRPYFQLSSGSAFSTGIACRF